MFCEIGRKIINSRSIMSCLVCNGMIAMVGKYYLIPNVKFIRTMFPVWRNSSNKPYWWGIGQRKNAIIPIFRMIKETFIIFVFLNQKVTSVWTYNTFHYTNMRIITLWSYWCTIVERQESVITFLVDIIHNDFMIR